MARVKVKFRTSSVAEVSASRSGNYLFPFMENLILSLKELGKVRTSETYASALNSFRRFRKGSDLLMDDLDTDVMMAYEAYLLHSGVSISREWKTWIIS